MSKRLFDLLLSAAGIVLTAPLILVCAALIKLDSSGPVLYRASRVGRDGRLFTMYKFRPMVTNAEKLGGSATPDDDPRITRMGHRFRSWKLDELPNLTNVFKGDMIFVGPRPQVRWAVDLYTPEQLRVLEMRPGITDYASLHFPNEGEILKGSMDPDRDYMEKFIPKRCVSAWSISRGVPFELTLASS